MVSIRKFHCRIPSIHDTVYVCVRNKCVILRRKVIERFPYFRSILGAEVEHDVQDCVVDDTPHQFQPLRSYGVHHTCEGGRGGRGSAATVP